MTVILDDDIAKNFIVNFPGIISVRDAHHKIVYVNPPFLDWLTQISDINPIGFTNLELCKNFDAHTAELFIQCHDLEIAYKFNEKINNKIITYKDKNNCTCYFEIMKFKVIINNNDYIFSLGKDVSALYSELSRYKRKAARDMLTGLVNRSALDEIGAFENCIFIYFDLDYFKKINDIHGHVTGDNLLVGFSKILMEIFPSNDEIVARIGGDEFLIVIKDPPPASAIAEKIHAVREKFNLSFAQYLHLGFGFSYGYCTFTGSVEETLNEADRLMYKNKAGRKRV